MDKLWFRAKDYGWGWTPCSGEGWIVTAIVLVALVGGNLAIVWLAADPAEITWRLGFLPHLPAASATVLRILLWNTLVCGAIDRVLADRRAAALALGPPALTGSGGKFPENREIFAI